MAKESQVMIIGDSYINWPTHTLPADLAQESGQTGWRLEAIGGSAMSSGGIAGFIPDQYTASQARDADVHTVVMDGSGNDVLIPDITIDPFGSCKQDAKADTLAQCKQIVSASQATIEELFDQMAADGVRDVVYFWYPHVPTGTLLGGAYPNVISDYAKPLIGQTCTSTSVRTNGALRCQFVDMTPVFEGHDDWFFPGDIHPTSEGSAAMAKAIWQVMEDECIGQVESSGCCTP
ncbi:MAG TPA: SGNH/GDSL hydrolase family protein [Polyangiales bacterium]|nr:SGNH/GDSL hydrolase family protein [Polyangiales bacterium]